MKFILRMSWLMRFLILLCVSFALAWRCPGAATTRTANPAVGEKVPSEDPVIKDLHSMGLIRGKVNVFRCASPVRDLVSKVGPATTTNPSNDLSEAKLRMKRLYDLGIRTVISFADPAAADDEESATAAQKMAATKPSVPLEKLAAEAVGLKYVSRPLVNSGPNSFQDMSDDAVLRLLDSISEEIMQAADTGGVAFHCSAGHDRTGIVAAYMRLKYQHWPVDQAIEEMRRYGHNWPKLSRNGGISSWHEDHLRAIADLLKENRLPGRSN